MPSPLHKTPLGLLELFRLKTLGRAPDSFGDTVIPVVNALQAYAAAELQSAGSAGNVGAINGVNGNTASVSVSSFQWIFGIAGHITLGAAPGTFITWEVGIILPQSCTLGVGELRTVVAGEGHGFGVFLPQPLVLRAGGSWFARVHGDAAGADHSVEARALYVPAANLV